MKFKIVWISYYAREKVRLIINDLNSENVCRVYIDMSTYMSSMLSDVDDMYVVYI